MAAAMTLASVLAAYLSGREKGGMDVRICRARPDRPNELVELGGSDTLPHYVDDLLWPDRSSYDTRARPRALWRYGTAQLRIRVLGGVRFAQPHDDAAGGVSLPEMDMRLGHVPLKVLIRELVMDEL